MAAGTTVNGAYVYTDDNGKKYNIAPNDHMQRYNIAKQQSDAMAKEKRQQLSDTLAQNNQQTNANYDNSARQAYIKYMQNKKALPDSLAAIGIRGGASETALMNLYNNYGSNAASLNAARNAELGQNRNNYNDTWNAYDADRRAALQSQLQQALADQQNQYNNDITQFSSTVHQYSTTRKGYEQYQKWIERLQKSNDPLKDVYVSLVRQQMATQFPNGKPSAEKKSSGGGGGGYYRATTPTDPTDPTAPKHVDNTPEGYVNGNRGYYHGASSKYQPEYAKLIRTRAGYR